MTTTPATQSLLPVTQDRLIYVRWSDDGQHIRKWAREPFEGATAFANAGNGAPLGPFDADDHYPAKDLPFALRSIAENIHVQCGDHVLEDMVRIVTDAASVIEASQAHSLPGDVGTDAVEAEVKRLMSGFRHEFLVEPDAVDGVENMVRLSMRRLAALTPSAPEPVQKLHELLAKASALQIGPSNEGHRIAIYFDDHNEAGKLFAALSDRAALATEAE